MRLLPYVLLPALGLSAPSPVPQNPLGPDVKSTMLRFGCSQLVIDRIDPLVNPDIIPSPHLHQIAGGNAFNASMPYDTDISTLADCTTCSFSEDLSNYWTANLYFRARNGSYKRVPQAPVHSFGDLFNDDFTHASNAGFVVYYVSEKPGDVTAFKPGFRMFTGDANSREKRGEGFKNQTCFRCYTGPDFEGDIMAPCADPVLDYEGLPDKPCYGIRSNVLYPTCWDGKNLDSPDHKSHVAYPITGPHTFTALGTGGQCPESHPVRIPQLMLEIVWDTSGFNDPNEWPEDGSQPFVLSTGDTTGYGQHGDYVFGWKGDSLQRAMDGSCFGALCHALKSQSVEEAAKCKVPERVGEQVDGWLDSLPGMPEIYGKK